MQRASSGNPCWSGMRVGRVLVKQRGSVRVLAVAAGVLLSACTIDDYRQPIDKLGTALATASASVGQLDQNTIKAQNDAWDAKLNLGDPSVADLEPAADSCRPDSPGCKLRIVVDSCNIKPDGSEDLNRCYVYPSQSLVSTSLRAVKHLNAYVVGLQAITVADTATGVTASANSALGSAQALAASFGNTDLSGQIKDYSTPIGAGVGWVVGLYVDIVKFRALRTATAEAHPAVEGLSQYVSAVAEVASNLEAEKPLEAFRKAQRAYERDENGNAAIRAAYVKAAADYNRVLVAKASQPLKAFAEAHEKLKMQLNGEGGISLTDAHAAIQSFAVRAEEFKGIVSQFEAAGKKGTSS